MGVRNPGELERCIGGVSDVDGVEQRPPREGLADGRGAEQQRFVNEGATCDLERVVGVYLPGCRSTACISRRMRSSSSDISVPPHSADRFFKASVLS